MCESYDRNISTALTDPLAHQRLGRVSIYLRVATLGSRSTGWLAPGIANSCRRD